MLKSSIRLLAENLYLDLDEVPVIRSTTTEEREFFNASVARPTKPWTVDCPKHLRQIDASRPYLAFEVNSGDMSYTQYVDIPISVVLESYNDGDRYKKIDCGRALVSRSAEILLIRPDPATSGSIVWIGGGAKDGLRVTKEPYEIFLDLGQQARHLTEIPDEGFIDRQKIRSINKLNNTCCGHVPDSDENFVTFEGIKEPQLLRARAYCINPRPQYRNG